MDTIFDVIIRNADIIDGTGAAQYQGDIAINGDRIVGLGDYSKAAGNTIIDASGFAVAPGFIDSHTHDDRMLLSAGDMMPKVSQGVTTVVVGNCGISLAPMPIEVKKPVTPPLDLLDSSGDWYKYKTFSEYVTALTDTPAATNSVLLLGHTTLRAIAMDDLLREANAEEIARMQEMVIEAMEAGAFGVSTGLAYPPAAEATTSEVIEVCRPMAKYDGLYATHMRDEGEHSFDSLDETFEIGQALNVQVLISHHKLAGVKSHGMSKETLPYIDKHMHGQRICLDCYPYAASSTILTAAHAASSPRTIVTWSKGMPEYTGRDLSEIQDELGLSQEEVIHRLLPAGAVYFRMDESDVQRILTYDPTMIGSDGLPHDEMPHPRLWGTFPRVLGHYSRDLGLFSLERAIHKMTGLTAKEFGIKDRGIIKEGAFADLTIFEPKTVIDTATFEKPIAIATGIDTVMVNGQIVWNNQKISGARPGRVLKRQIR